MAGSQNRLQHEIDAKAKEIHTDSYPMSIGEVMSLYRDKELDIHPEFQRFFRWTPLQKSKLIESILLGIPIPSVFVSQRENGVWDVIDGVQRLSTIFQFTGILRGEDDSVVEPQPLVETDYLPSLEGRLWDGPANSPTEFSKPLQLLFKRQKLVFNIVKKESDANAKYDLFERLNTLGSQLSDQELRNCLLVMINATIYRWLDSLSQFKPFQDAIALTDRALQERYDMELVLRFIILVLEPPSGLSNIKDVGAFLTARMRTLATDETFDQVTIQRVFERTFSSLTETMGESCFRRPDGGRGRGGFLISVFETVAMGLGYNLLANPNLTIEPAWLNSVYATLSTNSDFLNYSGSGISASSRIPRLVPLGRSLLRGA